MNLSQFCLRAFDGFLLPEAMPNETAPSVARGEAAVLLLLKATAKTVPVLPFSVPPLSSELQWHILLTVRSASLHLHPGEVCFPGGMCDANTDRNSMDTAIREAYEEVGLPPSSVHIIGALRPVINSRNVRIVPIVALLSNNFSPSYSSEVEAHFWAPLGRFLEMDGSAEEELGSRRLCSFEFTVSPQQNAVVFGITAALCVVAAFAIRRQLPKFVGGAATDTAEQLLRNIFAQFTISRVILPLPVVRRQTSKV